jgi:hypothetical protein
MSQLRVSGRNTYEQSDAIVLVAPVVVIWLSLSSRAQPKSMAFARPNEQSFV